MVVHGVFVRDRIWCECGTCYARGEKAPISIISALSLTSVASPPRQQLQPPDDGDDDGRYFHDIRLTTLCQVSSNRTCLREAAFGTPDALLQARASSFPT